MSKKNLLVPLAVFTFALTLPNRVLATDTTAPATSYVKTPSSPDGNNGWYKSVVTFDLTATDLESGVKEINYKIDTGAWVKVTFNDTLNLAPNPSFETAGGTSSGLDLWDATTIDSDTVYSQDLDNYEPSYPYASAKISTIGTGWHGINNQANFAVAGSYNNMTAAVSLKTVNVTDSAFFKIYAISQDGQGQQVVTMIATSSSVTGTTDWTRLSTNFVVSVDNAIGVYLDIGLNGTGMVYADAVTINSSVSSAATTFTVGSDNENHVVSFYSVDQANNTEIYNCSSNPLINCVKFKQDLTPPGNWRNSGAFRGFLGPSDHHLYVYTEVDDYTSGISTFTDKYQYLTEKNPTYGRYSNLMSCSSTWQPNNWAILISPPFTPGVESAYLLTPKTDFCNSNWKICKIVRFYSEDMAGNSATKDLCINGPWIKLRGEGQVRSNNNIDMLSEADDSNTDGLIEAQGTAINFFTSTKDWKVTASPTLSTHSYQDFRNMISSPTAISGTLPTTSGVYLINGDYQLDITNNYENATFNQIIFINGNLTIDGELEINNASTALFIVNGNVYISKRTKELQAGIIADGDIYTSYNVGENEASPTLYLRGLFSANQIHFQRTLQGTNNNHSPSEDFIFEPKYTIQLKEYFSKSTVKWLSVD